MNRQYCTALFPICIGSLLSLNIFAEKTDEECIRLLWEPKTVQTESILSFDFERQNPPLEIKMGGQNNLQGAYETLASYLQASSTGDQTAIRNTMTQGRKDELARSEPTS